MKPEIEQELSHTLLTELLAYQFASPVRWIETQDVFLKQHNTERVIEIGPSPTLAGMASRTIKAKYQSYDAALSLQRQVLCYSKDAKEIYYTLIQLSHQPPKSQKAESAKNQRLQLHWPLHLVYHLHQHLLLVQLNQSLMNRLKLPC